MGHVSSAEERLLRASAIAWIEREQQHKGSFRYAEVEHVDLGPATLNLRDRYRGIWRPAGWHAALSFSTSANGPYADGRGEDGFLRYKWRGEDGAAWDNRAMRNAMVDRVPLIWFFAIERGIYTAVAPVWLVAEEPREHQFVVAVDEAQLWSPVTASGEVELQREWVHRLVRERVHQPMFRSRVLRAYDTHCAVCKLQHASLIDAAHIIPDSHADGEAAVPNGLALCKIHHAAFDANILGITPDYHVQVRPDILAEIDGPMLEYGLKQRHGQQLLWLPQRQRDRPDKARLASRFAEFTAAVA